MGKTSGLTKKQLLNDRKSKIGKNGSSIVHNDFLALDGNVIRKALSSDAIEGVADGSNKFVANNETLYKKRQVYKPIFTHDQFYVKVDGVLSDLDEGFYYNIKLNADRQQCINTTTRSATGGQLRVEQVEDEGATAVCSVVYNLGNNRGLQGQQGTKGDKPSHVWLGTFLRFENPDGSFGSSINLQGPQGAVGLQGLPGGPGPQGMPGSPGVIGLTGATGGPGPAGPAGPGFNNRGVYDPLANYIENDYVSYNGSSYACITNSTGIAPVGDPMSIAKWSVLAQKGSDGAMGPMGLPGSIGATGGPGPAGSNGGIGPQGPAGPLINEFITYYRSNDQSVPVGTNAMAVQVIEYDGVRSGNSSMVQAGAVKQYVTCAFLGEHDVSANISLSHSFNGADVLEATIRVEVYATDNTGVIKTGITDGIVGQQTVKIGTDTGLITIPVQGSLYMNAGDRIYTRVIVINPSTTRTGTVQIVGVVGGRIASVFKAKRIFGNI